MTGKGGTKRQERRGNKRRQRGAGNIGKVTLKDRQGGCKKKAKGEYKDSQGVVKRRQGD
jgi:hypothetical protein